MSGTDGVVRALVDLDARVWAQFLRSLRARQDLPPAVGGALAHPASTLASGAPRRSLCEAVADSPDLIADLRSDTVLPAAVHAAIASGPSAEDAPEAVDARSDGGRAPAVPRADQRSQLQALRRSLDEERRRREGAEARAVSAEARAEAATAAADGLQRRVAELEGERDAAQERVDAAAARAERRASSRIAALERELAAERAALEALRREHERCGIEVTELRSERDSLLAQRAERTDTVDGPARAGRPLVLPAALREGTTEAAVWLSSRVDLLLIDGYNVAKLLRPDRTLEDQRRWLIERLRPFGGRAAVTPVVVFDGDRSSGQQHDVAGVDVRFSRGGVTADDEIVFAVAATDRPVLVVTDDVELGERVRAEGGNVVGAVHLLGIVDG